MTLCLSSLIATIDVMVDWKAENRRVFGVFSSVDRISKCFRAWQNDKDHCTRERQ